MDLTQCKAAAEAVLFAFGEPIALKRLADSLEVSEKEAEQAVKALIKDYESRESGLKIVALDDSYQICTQQAMAPYVRRALDIRRNVPLSQAAMEVLAIIAYNQPVTRARIEQVRGVDCTAVMQGLMNKGLIEEKGRLEIPGRPLLFGTTLHFLRCFQLESLEDLPPIPEDSEPKKEQEEADSLDQTGMEQILVDLTEEDNDRGEDLSIQSEE